MEKAKVLVTGAAGFIGAHLCDILLQSGHSVYAVDNLSNGNFSRIRHLISKPGFFWYEEDLTQIGKWFQTECLLVIHAASLKIPRYDSGLSTLTQNVIMTSQVIQYCKKNKSRLIFCSTSDVYGNLTPPFRETDVLSIGNTQVKRWNYAISKIYSEALISTEAESGTFSYVIVRLFGCYGPGESLNWTGGPHTVFIENILNNQPIEIHGDGQQIRSFVFISDVLRAFLLLINHPELKNEIVNICGDSTEKISIEKLADAIAQSISGKFADKKYIPYSTFGKYEDVKERWGDGSKAFQCINFKPLVSFDEGLKLTIDWHKSMRK